MVVNHPRQSLSALQAPIGVFDSGIGGLSVVRELRAALPAESVLYFADSAHCPYGTKEPEEIARRCHFVASTLLERGAKLLVVACNTASAVAIHDLRAHYPVPIVGLEPAVKPAARMTKTGRIAVLATPRTVASERLVRLVREHAAGVVVETIPAPGLVELVESGKVDGDEVKAALQPLVGPAVERGADVIVLGCTHYPFLRDAIEAITGPDVLVIDSGPAIARRTREVLCERGLAATASHPGTLSLLTSGDAAWVGQIAARLLGESIEAERVDG
ncbi:MAG TPA: glutamate racemase [Thermomicrobiales bacterium]